MRWESHFSQCLSRPLSQLLNAMVAKLGNREDPLPQDSFEGVDEDEWVSGGRLAQLLQLTALSSWRHCAAYLHFPGPLTPASWFLTPGLACTRGTPNHSCHCHLPEPPAALHTSYLCKLDTAALALACTSSPEALGFVQASGTFTAAGPCCSSRDCSFALWSQHLSSAAC